MSRGPVAPLPPPKDKGEVMVMLPPLWDVGWTVERPIGYFAEGPHPCGDPPPCGCSCEGAHGMRHAYMHSWHACI